MEGFVGRESELAELTQWWEGPSPRAALVWGRRRVGKTSLLRHFAERASAGRVVFHTGAGRPRDGELAELSRHLTASLPAGVRDLSGNPLRTWDEALYHLGELARDEPVMLVLDEFPELVTTSPELPGVLRAFLDRSGEWTRLRLLLCGSAVRTMQAIQEYRAPLYGRFDLSLHLHPFRPFEVSQLLPELTPADLAVVYGIVGGMPLYLSWWDQQRSVPENLRRLAVRPDARMLVEGDFVLAAEAGGAHPHPVLHAIAAGRTRHHEIADAVGVDPTRTLRDLITLRLVERVEPVTEAGRNTRRKLYRIADNFLSFHLRVLSRYRTEIERGLGDTILRAITASLDDHLGLPWEEAFRDHLRHRAGELDPQVVAVGPWWTADGQDEIDAVVLRGRSREPFLVGEAKWAKSGNAARIQARLARKAARLVPAGAELRYAVAARHEVTHADPEVLAVTAAEIFPPVAG
ncbi:ATP-binding protein [Natronosporangium hydrolyticum]|uniref:ATP-binding protein n=1 Tax=Natronosporangium hydrolyticum TaxID=2811111 RepID=A0A895Y7E2_9ACTN|nr:ATP-binding protein [Natronosporangium hydrolyticum]QSB13654.1 ATP-binding protein [Natronosporangium hydrolyticum]